MTVVNALYDPSSLRAGGDPLQHRDVMYSSGAAIVKRGCLLARVLSGGVFGTPAPLSTNTGNATLGTTSITAGNTATNGSYRVVWSTATAFTVYDPNGDELGTGVNATPFTTEVTFTATAGVTPMVAGDEIDFPVTVIDEYTPAVSTSVTATTQFAIASQETDVTNGAVAGPAYFAGTFAWEVMQPVCDASWATATGQGVDSLMRQSNSQLYIKTLNTLG